jgi:hypothetical protein
MIIINSTVIANNLEILFGEPFNISYKESRGPIQLIHQIARVRAMECFESNDFYRRVLATRLEDRRLMTPDDLALCDMVYRKLESWERYVIGREIELQAVRAWSAPVVSLGDLVWAFYLTVQTGGAEELLKPLEAILRQQVEDDDHNFYHQSEFGLGCREGQLIREASNRAIKILLSFS